MIFIHHIITCDAPKCDRVFDTHYGGKTDAIQRAREVGWAIGLDVLCPSCRKNIKTIRYMRRRRLDRRTE